MTRIQQTYCTRQRGTSCSTPIVPGLSRRIAMTRIAALAVLGGVLPLSAKAETGPLLEMAAEDWPAVQAAARKEGIISFYHNLRPQGVEQLLAGFHTANPGIRTEQMRLGSAPLAKSESGH